MNAVVAIDTTLRRRVLAAIDDPRMALRAKGEEIARALAREGLCYRRRHAWHLTTKGREELENGP